MLVEKEELERGSFESLVSSLVGTVESIDDFRDTGRNLKYSLKDIVLGAFSVFFSQSPSFLSHQRILFENHKQSNSQTIFGLEKIPCDNQIKRVLDKIEPSKFNMVFTDAVKLLEEMKILDEYRRINQTLLIGMDGTEFFKSEKINCKKCLTREKKSRDTTVTEYHHQALIPLIMSPEKSQVLPLWPEFISNTDGETKQDCENKAFKRWITAHSGDFSPLHGHLSG